MSTPSEEPTIQELVTRLAELEQAHARLQGELTNVRTEPAPALAAQPLGPGVFASSVAGTPAVSATGTNGADGVDASSDSGTGVSAKSTSGTGVFAQSGSFNAIHAVGGGSGVSGLYAEGGSGYGVYGTSASGIGVFGYSATGIGMEAQSGSGDVFHAYTAGGGTGVTAQSGTGTGVFAQSSSAAGMHVVGGGASPSNPPYTVYGITETAVFAEGGPHYGIVAANSSQDDPCILGINNGIIGTGTGKGIGTTVGVAGISNSGDAVYGYTLGGNAIHGKVYTTVGHAGFFEGNVSIGGRLRVDTGISVASTPAIAALGSNGADGMLASSDTGFGIRGVSITGTGVLGVSSGGYAGEFDGNVQVNGNFSATGTKNFVQAHPSDPGREVVYVALEGGEAGTYVRGSGQLQSGKAVLALPEHFGLVTATEGLTVQLTPRGAWLQLYVVELDTAQLVVREVQGKSGAFDYLIHGVRRGYEQHEVIRTKR